MKILSFFAFILSLVLVSSLSNAQNGIINTIVGGGTGSLGGPADSALLSTLSSTCFDGQGNMYVVNSGSNKILKVNIAGTISWIAGNGTGSYGGDGIPATDAGFSTPTGAVVDGAGNVLIADCYHHVIRKIDTSGIITRFAGTGDQGWTGDGGPATAANLNGPTAIVLDHSGNTYWTEAGSGHTIRKLSAFGIITTFAGSHYPGFGGDGSYLTSAIFNNPQGIVIDPSGVMYIADCNNNRIRKIGLSGMVSTYAGTGTAGYSGDGGAATAAEINHPRWIVTDTFGNLYFTDDGNNRVRKISTSGIITTVAGNGVAGYSGDGSIAGAAKLHPPLGISIDAYCNLFVTDGGNGRVRKITPTPDIVSDSFSVVLDRGCAGPSFFILTHHSSGSLHIKTYFGDGINQTTPIFMGVSEGYASYNHAYLVPGTYTIKFVLFNGSLAIDSTNYSYNFLLCNSIPIKYYYDALSNCIFDSSIDPYNWQPVVTEVDSNGIVIDTISATSGYYYNAYGNTGDVYSFRIINPPAGMTASCPGSGIIYDTLSLANHYINNSKYFGIRCASTGFDLAEQTNVLAGRHMSSGSILVSNKSCTPVSSNLTLHFSPKYVFVSSNPAPSSVSGNTVTWNITGMSSILSRPEVVNYTLTIPTTTWLLPGDTANSTIIVNPTSGDGDTTNNVTIRTDTIKTSYDPNEMSVIPSGYILPGSTLQYSVNFENTGNDTAFNIYVMDTLSDNLDPHTLNIVGASAIMNVSIIKNGGHNIIKFDFPNINLLDSSHHNKCDGLVIFQIKARSGLVDGTPIYAHAGIFFDDNPVVMTDTAENIISLVVGPENVCIGSHVLLSELASGGSWSSSNANVSVAGGTISGITSGTSVISYTISNQFGTFFTTRVMSVDSTPLAGAISGSSSVCTGTTILLTESLTGGTWNTTNSNATVTAGGVTGVAAGVDSVRYSVSNACGSAVAFHLITVNLSPVSGTIAGLDSVCEESEITLSDLSPGGVWSSVNTHASVGGGIVSGLMAGADTINYSVTNSCGTSVATHFIIVKPLPVAGSIVGPDSVCIFATITLTDSIPGGTWSASTANASVLSGVVTGAIAGTDNIIYTVGNACGAMSTVHLISIISFPDAGVITGDSDLCVGAVVAFSETSSGTWNSVYSGIATISPAGLVSCLSTGIDTIEFVSANSCGTAVTSKLIFISPLPSSITGDLNICEGNTSTLTSSGTGTWESGSTSTVLVGSSGIAAGLIAGTSAITYTSGTGCMAMATMTVNATPQPIIGDSIICVGDSAILTDATLGGTWGTSDLIISIIGAGLVKGISLGTALVSYTTSDGCNVVKAVSIQTCSPELSPLDKINEMSLYPNPSHSIITLTSTTKIYQVIIQDILGREVYSREYNTEQLSINLDQLLPGIYFVKINGTEVRKIIKE